VDGARGALIATEFDRHADTLLRYGGRLHDFPDFQFEEDEGVRGHTLPVRWDGTLEDLPRGIDGAFERAFEEGGANVLCAVNVTVPPELRGRGLSSIALQRMIELARAHGFPTLIAPVKPTLKERYPITPIERYAEWRRDDGLPFDPWMRTHSRLGAEILKTEPHSVRVSGTVAEWEEWTEMAFPESGEYVIPGGLQLLGVDREADAALYYEPNVWMAHAAG
jgi:GNAT superfamily N-acetyltransferase